MAVRVSTSTVITVVLTVGACGLYAAAFSVVTVVPLQTVAALGIVLFAPSLVIEAVGRAVQFLEDERNFPETAVARIATGYAERSFMFLVIMISMFTASSFATALNFIAAVVAIKALYRSALIQGADRSIGEDETDLYLIGTFLSIGLGTFLTWFLLAPQVPGLQPDGPMGQWIEFVRGL